MIDIANNTNLAISRVTDKTVMVEGSITVMTCIYGELEDDSTPDKLHLYAADQAAIKRQLWDVIYGDIHHTLIGIQVANREGQDTREMVADLITRIVRAKW